MFKNKAIANAPNGWSDEMVFELTARPRALDGSVRYNLLIHRIVKRTESFAAPLPSEWWLIAKLETEVISQLSFVVVRIGVTENKGVGRAEGLPDDSIGFLFLNEQKQLHGQPTIPLLEVLLFGGADYRSMMERFLVDAKTFGNSFVPMSINVKNIDRLGTTATDANGFSINHSLPVSQFEWRQVLNLSA